MPKTIYIQIISHKIYKKVCVAVILCVIHIGCSVSSVWTPAIIIVRKTVCVLSSSVFLSLVIFLALKKVMSYIPLGLSDICFLDGGTEDVCMVPARGWYH